MCYVNEEKAVYSSLENKLAYRTLTFNFITRFQSSLNAHIDDDDASQRL